MKQKLLLIFAVLVTTIFASAHDFEVDGIYYNAISLQDLICQVTYKDTNYNSYSGDIVIPSTVTYGERTFSVTSIGYGAFANCSSLSSVTISNTVTSIEDKAFYESSLTSVTIPNSVTSIGESVFEFCKKLISVTIPNSITSISESAFYGCSSLTSVTIPESVTSIGDRAFSGCRSLNSVTFPNSVVSIGDFAFESCDSLSSVIFPSSVTYIGIHAFAFCENLSSVTIPFSVTSIGDSAFDYGAPITDYICDNEKYVAYFKRSVVNLTFGGNVNNIVCSFDYFTKLENLTINNNIPPTFSQSNPFTNGQIMNLGIYVPADAIDIYKTADVWMDFWNINPIKIDEGGDTPENKMCAEPTIELVNGELVATSATEGAICYISITSEDMKSVDGMPIALTGVYNVSSYAHAEDYQNSKTVTAKVVWVNPTIEGAGIFYMEAKKAVLIRAQNGEIIVSGTERGESLQLYNIDGQQLCSVTADEGQTIIPYHLEKGQIVIVRYGGKSVKILM